MAASATLHCLTGCAIGEITGLLIGTALGWSVMSTMALAIGLAFVFGYALSSLPLLRAGLPVRRALTIVLAADTLSILTMEVVDNAVMAAVPGAMDAGLTNPVFWLALTLALGVAFAAAYPVNAYLLERGKGHALTHEYHHAAHGDHAEHAEHAAHAGHAMDEGHSAHAMHTGQESQVAPDHHTEHEGNAHHASPATTKGH
jgi:hypothetical protein